MKYLALCSLLIFSLLIQGCFTRKVERVGTQENIDLSGRWNDSDSRMTAEAMVDQILGGRWIDNHVNNRGDRPVVIVGLVYNKSHEHISAETFIRDVERSFINSGRVRLVQAGDKREELRQERASQQDFASIETAKAWGEELGADYMLNGDINSIVDTHGRERVNYYQVNLELTDIQTSEVVWIGDKSIRKYIRN
ncbi:penicillin-binding protein activator LpoB [Marinilabiliaceae bacterium ANBcel2]|nr:penicillin-binding protein activator LpoB [Marinilabiliaceae bacterium ANBcel2]